MSFYMMTDQEKVDLVKNFSKRATPWVVAGLVLLVIAFSAFSYWQNHREHRDYAASQLYQSLLALNEHSPEKAEALAETLLQDYSDLQYANWAAFYLAESKAELGHFEEAKKNLDFVLTHKPTAAAQNLALVRLSQIAIELNQLNEAKQLLERLDPDFSLLKNSILSDIYALENNTKLARQADALVLSELQTEPLIQDWFRMKLSHLPTKGS